MFDLSPKFCHILSVSYKTLTTTPKPKVVHGLAGVPLPFHTCGRPTQSTIAAFCSRHQSPISAYQLGSRAFSVAGPQTWIVRRDISRIIGDISLPRQDKPVQEVFSW